MPQKAKKPCAYPECKNLIQDGRFCFMHQNESQKQRKESNQYYDERLRDQKTKSFYKSRAWQVVRHRALIRDNYLCQDCLKESRITRADTVHHRVEISKDWSKRLDINNLLSLCMSCHNVRHGVKEVHDLF